MNIWKISQLNGESRRKINMVYCVWLRSRQSPRLSETDGGRFSNFIKETRPFLKQQHYFQSPLGDGLSLQNHRHQFKYRIPGKKNHADHTNGTNDSLNFCCWFKRKNDKPHKWDVRQTVPANKTHSGYNLIFSDGIKLNEKKLTKQMTRLEGCKTAEQVQSSSTAKSTKAG